MMWKIISGLLIVGLSAVSCQSVKKDMRSDETAKSVSSKSSSEIVDSISSNSLVNTNIYPQFPGGESEMMAYISKNLKLPSDSQTLKVGGGRIVCQFVVKTDGSLSDIKVIKGLAPTIDSAMIETIASMPKWKPAIRMGKPVATKFTLPFSISFQQ